MRILLIPFALVFQLAVSLRKLFYNIGLIKQIEIKAKVISIGNISVGGTGKTPFIIYLSKLLNDNQISTVVISSGYKRKTKSTSIYNPSSKLSFYNQNLNNDFGDEATTYILNNPLIPVVVDSKKWKAALIAQNEFNPQVILVDDGLQHWKLKRDLDFVIIDDRTNNSPNFLLPYTRLREKFIALKRADLILKRDVNELNNVIQKFGKETISLQTKQLGLFTFENNQYKSIEIQSIGKAISISSIALPEKFHKFVISLGVDVAEVISFSDHFAYNLNEVEKLCTKCNQIGAYSVITTEKDYVKLKSFLEVFSKYRIQLIVSRIEIEVTDNFEILKQKLKQFGINID